MNKMNLLVKAAHVTEAADLNDQEMMQIATLLDMDSLFKNFSEEDIRNYRDQFSGQPLQGMKTNKDSLGNVTSFSFIPPEEATRMQMYEGLIFSLINPAARNMCRILYWLQPSDFVKMPIGSAAAWGVLVKVLTSVKEWSAHLEIVNNPGAIIMPFGVSSSNLLVLDSIFFNSTPKYEPITHIDSFF